MYLLMYEHTLTSGQVAMLFLAFIITLLAYLLKDIPVIGKAWYVIKIFWIVVFGTLLFNFAKKEIKEWWYKD
jgi:ABC-type multidrug transport system permease subunit